MLVQWIECRTPDSGAGGSSHGVGRYFFLFTEKFTECFQTFIYILARLSLCVICICQVNACISEFGLLLSTYSKWLYNDQFPPYLVYMYIAHFHITHFPSLIILIVTKFMLNVSGQISNHASWEDLTVIFHVNPMCKPLCITPIPIPLESLCTHFFLSKIFLFSWSQLIE